MKSRTIRSSNPVEILISLEKLDKVQYNKNLISYFKGYVNTNHSCFINAWLQAIFVVKAFINEIKNNPEEALENKRKNESQTEKIKELHDEMKRKA